MSKTVQEADSPRARGAKKPARKRLKRKERERMIVEGAVEFFAEVGFDGRTRELADRIGVTQPLLYRYFPTKDALIERVYHETFLGRWKPEWEDLLADRSKPLRERLTTVYLDYVSTVLTRDSVRIFMYSGLKDGDFNRRYLAFVRTHLLTGVCREVRAARGLPDPETSPLTEDELESAWGLHGSFFYIGIRRFIYGLETPDNLERAIDRRIGAFLDGAGREAARAIEEARREPQSSPARTAATRFGH